MLIKVNSHFTYANLLISIIAIIKALTATKDMTVNHETLIALCKKDANSNRTKAALTQLVEYLTKNQTVAGSNPACNFKHLV